jgi:hypothetical protein
MEIKGKVHCFFEQSGTFKREFIKLGIPAEDYDIQNNFNETDHVSDLFGAIEDAYNGKLSLWDNITKDDLILAFFPCIYFCEKSQVAMTWDYVNYRKLTPKEKSDKILERSANREKFFRLATMMLTTAQERGIRLIMENPWSAVGFLKNNFIMQPALVDMDRQRRGDYFRKPTAFWFVNCEPTHGQTFMAPKERKTVAHSKASPLGGGVCSEERSMISHDYARNFICDFVIGREQVGSQMDMFKDMEY